jgi:hypothetical protein
MKLFLTLILLTPILAKAKDSIPEGCFDLTLGADLKEYELRKDFQVEIPYDSVEPIFVTHASGATSEFIDKKAVAIYCPTNTDNLTDLIASYSTKYGNPISPVDLGSLFVAAREKHLACKDIIWSDKKTSIIVTACMSISVKSSYPEILSVKMWPRINQKHIINQSSR